MMVVVVALTVVGGSNDSGDGGNGMGDPGSSSIY